MNKNIKSKNNIIFIVMIVLSISIILGTGAYAYYQTNINGTTSGTIAKWDFKANNQTESFDLDFGSLYPGKNGTYNLEFSAENSDLDVYYEFIINNEGGNLTGNLYFDNNYTIGPSYDGNFYVGMYGIIPAGEKTTIPLYYNWPYTNNDDSYFADGNLVSTKISIIGQQHTTYSGSIPMNLFGLTLASATSPINNNIVPIFCTGDEFGWGCGDGPYYFDAINATTGYIILK